MTLRLQNMMLAMLLALTTLFVGLGTVGQNPMSGGYQLFERAASGISGDNALTAFGNFDPSPENASEYVNATNKGLTELPEGSIEIKSVGAAVNAPKDFKVYQTPSGDKVYQSPNGNVYSNLDDIPQVSAYNNKHVPPKNTPWKNVVEGTKSGPAKYAPDVDINETTLKAWEIGTPVNNGKDWKVYDTGQTVGAKNGQQTSYMRVEMSPDGQLHGHPITTQEAAKLTK